MIVLTAFVSGLLLGLAGGVWACYRAMSPRVVEVGEKWAGTVRDDYPRHKRPGGV